MRRNVVLRVSNGATYLDQTQAIMEEKRVVKSFIYIHVIILLRMCGYVPVQLHASPEKAWYLSLFSFSERLFNWHKRFLRLGSNLNVLS